MQSALVKKKKIKSRKDWRENQTNIVYQKMEKQNIQTWNALNWTTQKSKPAMILLDLLCIKKKCCSMFEFFDQQQKKKEEI